MSDTNHQDLILDQFTRQATVFSTAAAITDEDALRMIVEAARPTPDDRLLDVACGPGLVVCALAPHVREATGIDMTPAMLEMARKSAIEAGPGHVEFREGLAESLPVPDSWADVVISNGVLNLTPDKQRVLGEMFRVLRSGGRLQIGDILVNREVPEGAKKKIDLWTG